MGTTRKTPMRRWYPGTTCPDPIDSQRGRIRDIVDKRPGITTAELQKEWLQRFPLGQQSRVFASRLVELKRKGHITEARELDLFQGGVHGRKVATRDRS